MTMLTPAHPPQGERPAVPRFVPALALAAALFLLLWWAVPALLAPVADFEQGPGGAVAYVSVSQQIREQSAAFWTGGDVHLRLNEAEVSGMISSALLTGRQPGDPVERVRSSLVDGAIQVEAVAQLPAGRVPERLRGPLGIRLRLEPAVTETGEIQFRITRARVGHVPVSPSLIRLAGEVLPINGPGFNAREASISLPLGDLISQSLGRRIEIRDFTAGAGELNLTIAMN